MLNDENTMAYVIITISIVVFIASFYIDKINFEKPNSKKHH